MGPGPCHAHGGRPGRCVEHHGVESPPARGPGLDAGPAGPAGHARQCPAGIQLARAGAARCPLRWNVYTQTRHSSWTEYVCARGLRPVRPRGRQLSARQRERVGGDGEAPATQRQDTTATGPRAAAPADPFVLCPWPLARQPPCSRALSTSRCCPCPPPLELGTNCRAHAPAALLSCRPSSMRHSDDGNVVILLNRATHLCPSCSRRCVALLPSPWVHVGPSSFRR